MSSPIRILLVDDRSIARTGIRSVLDEDGGIEVVGEVSDRASAVGKARELRPHLLLAGALPDPGDAVELVDQLAAYCGGAGPGVLLITHEGGPGARRALRAGVHGVVLHRVTPEQLLSAIHVVAAGYRIFFDEEGPRPGGGRFPGATEFPGVPAAGAAGFEMLTRREREVFRLLAQGLSNTEISAVLVLSENTVKSHVQRLLEKLHLRNRVHAVIHAYRMGLMAPLCPEPGRQRTGDHAPGALQ
ncbi:LuxR C-terminal-related transcriptional regulator [Streptomyces fuscichromogenes]|uniref:DNA-binding response regulator n=1 Tax=Streptomyces fuscichromogenes TaxID=1324013 RepID=A0A917XCW6_9ACTN|nr:response regulator transcription factor [Streptomyces fuscichromogenes]GGN09422.1 DNA-binding response regulator [Streptomyces fuscichromogenes]